MARCVGIEPTFSGLESVVLPLDEQRKKLVSLRLIKCKYLYENLQPL